jgi:hypothetical protein
LGAPAPFPKDLIRLGPLDYSGLRGEGSIPVPLPPPYWPRPRILWMNSRAIEPCNSSDFSFELRTPDRESRLIVLRTARFSPKLWTPFIRYGLAKFERLELLKDCSGKRFRRFSLGQAKASDF